MAEATGISWSDATFNGWVGCTKVSTECKHCYAETLVTGTGPRQMNRPGTWGPRGTRERTSASTWAKPRRWAKLAREGKLPDGSPNLDGHRPRIFCASLADVFEPRAELEPWRSELFDLIEATPELDWLLLTKRPEEARDWLHRYYVEHRPLRMRDDEGTLWTHTPSEREWTSRDGIGWGVLPNVWVGTSIGTAEFTWRADVLRQIPAAVRFISAEPLLSSLFEGRPPGGVSSAPDVARDGVGVQDRAVGSSGSSPALSTEGSRPLGQSDPAGRTDGEDAPEGGTLTRGRAALDLTGIDWVIAGGESGGREARPMSPVWVREIRDAVLAREIPPGGLPHGEHPHDYGYERPALHVKQWGSYAPRGFVSGKTDTDDRPEKEVGTGVPGDERWRMFYYGPGPKSGGKLLDGVEHCEFPTGAGALTPA